MKKILQHLFEYKTLSRTEARKILLDISSGTYNDTEITAFITVFLMRIVTIQELQGFTDALMEICVKVNLNGYKTIDIVGTGGDGKNTFNISTLSCFIVAGAGFKVAKHGNYGASAISGASNVMEHLGYKFKADNDALLKEVDEANICFLHAPVFHPALKTVAPIRRNLGLRTFFNMLGPLVNPSQPDFQLIGVYSLEMARIYNYVLQNDKKIFTLIHSLDGYDEISLTADTKIISDDGEFIKTPQELGKRSVQPEALSGGASTADAGAIFIKILKGDGSWAQNSVVLANAASALYCTKNFSSYEDAYQQAVESLESGKAYNSFKKLIDLQSPSKN